MFCPNCGKQTKDSDNFCKYCGTNLKDNFCTSTVEKNTKIEPEIVERKIQHETVETIQILGETFPDENQEELVLYDVKKHYMAFFWPILLSPLFFAYFWKIFLNTHSFFSWIIAFAILTPIVYPILRCTSDKMLLTTKYIRIKMGIFNIEEIDIPIKKINLITIEQTFMGRMLNYGSVIFKSPAKDDNCIYGYIQNFDEFTEIVEDPAKFIQESLIDD